MFNDLFSFCAKMIGQFDGSGADNIQDQEMLDYVGVV